MSRRPHRTMPSPQARLIARGLRRLIKPRRFTRKDIPLVRALMHTLTRARLPAGVTAERVKTPVRGEWLRPQQARRGRVLLYLHGGGYICGAPIFSSRAEPGSVSGVRVGGCPSVAASLVLVRSEEHTSELQSLMRISYAVFCL